MPAAKELDNPWRALLIPVPHELYEISQADSSKGDKLHQLNAAAATIHSDTSYAAGLLTNYFNMLLGVSLHASK